jgi:hypothetical protein
MLVIPAAWYLVRRRAVRAVSRQRDERVEFAAGAPP